MKRTNDVDYRWATAARWAVAVVVFAVGADMLPDNASDGACCAVFIVAVAVFHLLKWKARREQEHHIDAAELRESIGR